MNKNTNKWAVNVDSENTSEAIQRLAFSYGYRWPEITSLNESLYKDAPYLVFDPKYKLIQYCEDMEGVEKWAFVIYDELEDVIESFRNPPPMPVKQEQTEPGKFPLVRFFYDKGVTHLRVLLVTSQDTDYIQGYEKSDGYRFKKFLMKHVGVIEFLGFSEKPSTADEEKSI